MSSQRQYEELRRREERDTALAAEALRPLQTPELDARINRGALAESRQDIVQ